MGKLICKLALLFVGCFWCLSISAYEGLKSTKKKNPNLKVESKNPLRASKLDVEDTLVFEKAKDDTLIFADDELNHQHFKKQDKQTKDELNPSGKNEKPVSLHSNIYPNPSSGIAWVKVDYLSANRTEIIITTLEGRLVRSESFSGTLYKIEDLASGAYIITLKNGKELVRKRFFVN